jgi:hypothetical protein
MDPDAACAAGISQRKIGVEVLLKSISSADAMVEGEPLLLSEACDAGKEGDDSCAYSQLSLRSEQ